VTEGQQTGQPKIEPRPSLENLFAARKTKGAQLDRLVPLLELDDGRDREREPGLARALPLPRPRTKSASRQGERTDLETSRLSKKAQRTNTYASHSGVQ
jgi:hypothetical protein